MSRRALLFTVVLAACGESTSTTDASAGDGAAQDATAIADASTRDADTEEDAGIIRVLEIGTGENAFEPLSEGQEIVLNRGPQGGSRYYGFHVWVGAKTTELDPQGVHMTFTIKTNDELRGESPYTENLDDVGGGAFAKWGLRVLLDDCCLVEGQMLTMTLVMTDRHGVSATDIRQVRAPAECPRGLPNPTIDPCP
jgi:hypothetical protein